ncbi:F-box/WD repeat-containing protein [Actinidia chinensis var. chinensis]|uniref:F-box/WD repeat-containing protein n=1 Tax=Actinidia chinensis var. chinensis TaxID=1590841 RepID=A0A2R6PA37_ACTCC|nr:F-box/WD repeat-containing protein [Actinidia chinensis var. chinensis]
MAVPSSSITDLNMDSLVHCADYLSLRDISSLAMSCKYLGRVASSDSIWLRFSREQWPEYISSGFTQTLSVREAYLARHTAVQQFKFVDPLVADLYTEAKPYNHLFLNKNDIIFSQGSLVHIMRIDNFLSGRGSFVTLSDHNSRITCMRLFPLSDTSLFRSKTQRDENVLVTSSRDHSIRLWWKGSCQRCFRGHNGPVSSLSDKLLGNGNGKIFASGGVDATVRLWSLSSSGKRGQHALKATLYGHEKPVVLMSVAGHKISLLVSISKDSKVRVWDTTTSSAVRSSCCVGTTSVPGAPVGMRCHESLVYAAAGSSVVAIDLRTMQKVFTVAIQQGDLHSFEIIPSKFLICAGGTDRAMLWDVRKTSETPKAEPVAELDGHTGAVTHLHMDPYKIVTGGPEDSYINVWETDTGTQTNSLICCSPDISSSGPGCSAMAVNGCQIVTASCGEELGLIRYRDFNNATCHVSSNESGIASKFWEAQSYSHSDEVDG